MTHKLKTLICILLVFTASPLHADPPPVIADYNAEVRGSDGRVDIPVLVRRLTELRVNTYFFLIWHRETDWEDLKLFLPAAQSAGIDTWVYLVPPSESPPIYGTRYSEPFRLDYMRWAEEIALLSLAHPNLKAFVIDDFWANRNLYTPAYVSTMRQTARDINPNMEFWPLMYYPEMDRAFVRDYGNAIDGIVAAYPKTAQTVQQTWQLLNDQRDTPARWQLAYPQRTRSAIGDAASLQRRYRVQPNAEHYTLQLAQQDSYEGPTAGYHFKQLLIDDQIVWEEDVAGGEKAWQTAEILLTPFINQKSHITLTMRVYDRKRVSNFEPTYKSANRYHIPLIVMIAATRYQFVKRNGEPGTAERIRDKIKMALVQRRRGSCEGVVTYALPKVPDNEIFKTIRRLFLKASTSRSADFDGNGTIGFEDFLLFANAYGKTVGEYATVFAHFDLDLDGKVGFGDFLIFVRAFDTS